MIFLNFNNIGMFRHPFFILLFVVLVAVSILHSLGLTLFWYGRFNFLDLITHFLGGFWISGIALWLFLVVFRYSTKKNRRTLLRVVLSTIICVGIGWEIFEFIIRDPLFFISNKEYAIDTALDLVVGIFGALSALWYFLWRRY